MEETNQEPKPEEEERPADSGDPGDWGNAARWVVFGNRPNMHRHETEKETEVRSQKSE